jgi:hypothetical protein
LTPEQEEDLKKRIERCNRETDAVLAEVRAYFNEPENKPRRRWSDEDAENANAKRRKLMALRLAAKKAEEDGEKAYERCMVLLDKRAQRETEESMKEENDEREDEEDEVQNELLR